MFLEAVPTAVPNVRQGRAKGLAVSGPKRSPFAPEIPTISEQGLPGFSIQSWFGLYGPKGMPPELARRINEELNKVMQSPDMVARFSAMGIEAGRGSPADFAAMVAADSARWGRLAKDRNIKLD
jgi:tripartite-type tricarboxylate transporter receptor subunit TctC